MKIPFVTVPKKRRHAVCPGAGMGTLGKTSGFWGQREGRRNVGRFTVTLRGIMGKAK